MAAETTGAKLIREVDELLCAGFAGFALESYEENRAKALLLAVSKLPDHAHRGFYVWSITKGLVKVNGSPTPIEDSEKLSVALDEIAALKSGLVVLCDVAPYLDDAKVVRKLRELLWAVNGKDMTAPVNESRDITVCLLGAKTPDIPALAKEIKVLKLGLPDAAELRTIAATQAEQAEKDGFDVKLDAADLDRLAAGLSGLSVQEAENALAKAIVHHGEYSAASIETVVSEKADLINAIPGCHYEEPEDPANFGGYGTAIDVCEDAAAAMIAGARAFAVDPLKGGAFTGAPGTGKSYLARIFAARMRRPLTRIDIGELLGSGGGIYGQAEVQSARLLDALDKIGGVVLVDEADKLFQGMESSGQTDGGSTARVIGSWMTWLAKQTSCFVIFTMNDATKVNPAILRNGRLDFVLFFDLPVRPEREKILAIHLRRRGRDPKLFDLASLSVKTNGYSGAELEALVKKAIVAVWREAQGARDISDADLDAARASINPLSEMSPDEIEGMRAWARRAKAIRANDPDDDRSAEPSMGELITTGGRRMIGRRN